MNKQDNENINTSLLQGEVSPQAVVLPTGIIKPTGGITGIIPPTGITPTGIRPTGILPTDNLFYQPTPFKKFKYQPKGSSSFNAYE